jgi:hypothetical protein
MRAVALIVALSGCSWVLTKKPPPASPPPAFYPECMESYVPQAIDGAIAVLATVGAIYFSQSGDSTDKSVGVLIEGGIAVGFGLSALTTIKRPAGCRDARNAWRAKPETRGY